MRKRVLLLWLAPVIALVAFGGPWVAWEIRLRQDWTEHVLEPVYPDLGEPREKVEERLKAHGWKVLRSDAIAPHNYFYGDAVRLIEYQRWPGLTFRVSYKRNQDDTGLVAGPSDIE